MINKITRKQHGVIDYGYAITTAVMPYVAGFADDNKAKNVAQAIGGGVLLSSLLTKYELGLVKVIPFKAHLAIDAVVGMFAIGSPWLFGFYDNIKAREAFFVAGLSALLVVAATQKTEASETDV